LSGSESIYFRELDLSDLDSVWNFAKNFIQEFKKCDMLINNAGVFQPPEK
jgi:NAD(P)-dependent dehydrogenase (short-subunit alcohol dehydrogenase family)